MCGSGVARQMGRRGRSVSNNIASFSNRELSDVPCLSLRKENSDGKALRQESSRPKAPSAVRVSGGAAC